MKRLTLLHQLKALTKHLLVLTLPLTVWTTEQPMVAQAPANGGLALSPTLESYRKYALTHEGDVARGASLFRDEQKLACSKCHSVDGRAGQAGPDLFAVGDKFEIGRAHV